MREENMLRKILEDNNYRVTRPRLIVFRSLLSQDPLSLSELISRSKGTVNRVSVYRIVEQFEKLGIVRRVNIGWKYKVELSELFLDHHHHITCLGCHKIVAVKENAALEHIIDEIGKGSDFTISSHHLELQGYCQKCQRLRINIQTS